MRSHITKCPPFDKQIIPMEKIRQKRKPVILGVLVGSCVLMHLYTKAISHFLFLQSNATPLGL